MAAESDAFVRTSVLMGLCNPFKGCWIDLDAPLTVQDVRGVLKRGEERLRAPYPGWYKVLAKSQESLRKYHSEKVAWFVRNGFTQPLEVDVGVPSLGCYVSWPVQDGNHRLAAAIYKFKTEKWDPLLPVAVSGSLSHAKELGLLPAGHNC